MEPTRQDLCHAALNGDADAFEELIHETSNTLYAVAFALLQNREEARDVVQDTYVRVWNKRQRIREADKLVPFLITTTRNRAHDLMRRRKFRSDQPVDQENEPDSGPGPDGTLSAEERHATIREGLRALPEKYRVASLLSAGADYEYTPGSGGAFGGEATKDIVGEAEAFMVQTDPADTAPVSKAQSANRRNLKSELLESNGEARRDRSDLADENEPVPESPAPNRKLITNVRIEYEVESYQAAADAIELRLDQAGGYLAGQDVRRFPNGKLQGTLIARVPAEQLEAFLSGLEGIGEVLGRESDVQDISDQYVDTQARLRNAQRMEERLIELLQTDTKDVADLLKVEKELGRVRESIEQMQAQIKTWDTLVSFATVRFLISEKNLDEPAAFLLRESIEMTILTNAVETAYDRIKEIAVSRGAEIARAILIDQSREQVSAEVRIISEPDGADELEAALREVGSVQAYESKIERTATSGSGETGTDKTEQDKTVFEIRLRSESQPAERVHLIVRTEQVATQLQALKALANSSNFDIRQSNYQRAANDSQSAILVVRMPENDSTAFVDQVHKTGKVESFTVQRNEHPGLEGAPAEIVVNLTSQGRIITDENSLGAVLRLTFGQAVSAISWSVRMIGVAIAFLLPWAAAATAAWLLFRAIHKRRGSSGK